MKKIYLTLKKNGLSFFIVKVKQKIDDYKKINNYRKYISKQSFFKSNDIKCGDLLVSIVVPLYNTDGKHLIEMINSVINQTYKNWELCLVDASDDEHMYVNTICEEIQDNRVKYYKMDENKGISANTNFAISMAKGDFIALLDHDDVLHESALFETMSLAYSDNADFIYTDELTFKDKIDNIISINYKSDYGVDNLRAVNYICHFVVFRKNLYNKVGCFRDEYNGSQDHDLFLRLCDAATNIIHVPKVLYFWRYHASSVSADLYSKDYAIEAGKKAVKSAIISSGFDADIQSTIVHPTLYRIKYDIDNNKKVTIIINDNNSRYTARCLKSIIECTKYSNYEIIVTVTREEDIKICDSMNIKYLKVDEGKSVTERYNYAAKQATGEYFVFVSCRISKFSDSWIDEMLMYSQREDVGAVGCKIVSKRNRIRHAGLKININSKDIFESYAYNKKKNSFIDMGRLFYSQEVMAVSGNCIMISREIFEGTNGFNYEYLNNYWDIDFCLQLLNQRYNIVFTPYAEITVDSDEKNDKNKVASDRTKFIKKWRNVIDSGEKFFRNGLIAFERNR